MTSIEDPEFDPDCDFDCSGLVAAGDLGWFAAAWLRSCSDLVEEELPPCRRCGFGSPLQAQDGEIVVDGSDDHPESDLTQSGTVKLELRMVGSSSGDDLPAVAEKGFLPGEAVNMELWVRDDLADSAGLTAVYADLKVNPRELSIDGIDHGPTYSQFAGGAPDNSQINRLGGATMKPGVAVGTWKHVATVQATALMALPEGPRVKMRPSYDGVAGLGTGTIPDDRIEIRGNVEPLGLIEFDVIGNGQIIPTPKQAAYKVHEVVQIRAIPDQGWQFDHWENHLSGSDNPMAITTPMEPIKVTAVFIVEPQFCTCGEGACGGGVCLPVGIMSIVVLVRTKRRNIPRRARGKRVLVR